jgi:hypothetical protein
VSRGCCTRCLLRHRKAIDGGETTWAELEARGVVARAEPMGQAWRRFSPFQPAALTADPRSGVTPAPPAAKAAP